MKKSFIIMLAAAVGFMAACTKEPASPELSFDKQVYVLLSDGSTDVKVNVSAAPSADLTVDVAFAGAAVKGTDYTVSAESVTIKAGETSGVLTITASENYEASDIQLSLTAPAGYVLGRIAAATVTVDAKEKIIYSFSTAEATVLDSYVVKLQLKGVVSGDKFVASADMEIPVVVEGSVDACVIDASVIKVAKGSNVGTMTVKAADVEIGDEATVTVKVDDAKMGARYVAGDVKAITLNISGVLKLSSLVGTWTFDSIYDEEDVLLFFLDGLDDDEMDAEWEALPLDNEGFTITIAEEKDEEGNVTAYKLIPGTSGDFAAYFRESYITYCAPINTTSDAEVLGPYSAAEMNMFVSMVTDDYQYNTYFELSNVNRSFDNSSESLGKGAISLYLDADGGLTMSIHDYDQPPFGFYWWEDGKFDADMFGLASLFTKAE